MFSFHPSTRAGTEGKFVATRMGTQIPELTVGSGICVQPIKERHAQLKRTHSDVSTTAEMRL